MSTTQLPVTVVVQLSGQMIAMGMNIRLYAITVTRIIIPVAPAVMHFFTRMMPTTSTAISRLGRSTQDLLNIIDVLQQKQVTLVSSKENIDTNTPQERFVLSIFAALSELEREQTLQRQREDIAIAKSQGKNKGRQPLPIDWVKFGQLYQLRKSGTITAVWFQKEMGLCANTFYRRLKEYERNYT